MTNKDASFLLGAYRPNGSDSSDPDFAEALAQADHDPYLKAAFEDQRRFDSAIAACVQSIPVPADLRSRILTGGNISRAGAHLGRHLPWAESARRLWPIAAMIALLAGLGGWYSMHSRHDSIAWENQALDALNQLLAGNEKFDASSPRLADLQQWLRANGSPSEAALPPGLQHLASLGCKTLSWNGHPISIICFHGPGGELVHLAMMDRSALLNPPPYGHPVYETRDGWRLASWSQGNTAMMLATRAPESQLRALLGMLFLL
jgi:hypothetical protein